MPKLQINLNEEEDKIIKTIMLKENIKNKEDGIKFCIKNYNPNSLE